MNRREAMAGGAALMAFPFGSAGAQERKAKPGDIPFLVGARTASALHILGKSPFVSIGKGRVVYAEMSNLCPYCQILHRRHPGPIAGLEMRYIAVPLNTGETGEVARVWMERTPLAYNRYMAGGLRGTKPATQVNVINNPPTGPDQVFTYHFRQLAAVDRLFREVYPDQSFVGTPKFFLQVNDELGHMSGVSALKWIIDNFT